MSRKLDTTNAGLFKRAMSRAGAAPAANGALFGLSSRMRYREIPLEQVEPNPEQPRRNAREADIGVLAASIAEKGLLQPINVREVAPDRFMIVAGERRYWAFRQLERGTIPALVIDTDDVQALALIENVQRLDLHPLELAGSLGRLIDEKGLVQEQAAVLIGKSQEYVSRLLGILKLPARILAEAPQYPQVSVSVLMELVELGDEAAQLVLWERAKTGLTVKAVREAKQERRGALPSPAFRPMLRTMRKTVDRMRDLGDAGASLSIAERNELRDLRDELTALLGE